MNSRSWPQTNTLTPVNTSAATEGELRQVFATLNNLIAQFNELTNLAGGIESQITTIINRLGELYPYDGSRDTGYITNTLLKNWPNDHFTLGKTVSGVNYTVIDVAITGSGAPSTSFTANAGTVNFAGSVGSLGTVNAVSGFASGAYTGVIGLVSTGGISFYNGLYIGGSFTGGGGLHDEPTDDGTPYLRVRDFEVEDGYWVGLEDELGTCLPDISLDAPWAGSEDLTTLGTITTGTWNAEQIGLEYLADIAQKTVLGNVTGSPGPVDVLSADDLIGIIGLYDWSGSTELTTIGTITTGTWNGDQIATGYLADQAVTLAKMANLSANSILGNNTGSSRAPLALSVTDTRTLILTGWTGSTALTMLGTIATCAAFTSQGTIAGSRFKGAAILPASDSTTAVQITNAAQSIYAVNVDTVYGVTSFKKFADSGNPLNIRGREIYPTANSTNGIMFGNASWTTIVLNIDTTNNIVRPNRITIPIV